MQNLNIAIVGATGKVGLTALELLMQRGHPADRVIAIASERSAGKKLRYGNSDLTVRTMSDDVLTATDVAIVSATNDISATLCPKFAEHGALAIDDSSVFRLVPDVPLVVPEVNGEDVVHNLGIIAIPNCSVSPLVMLLAPLLELSNFNTVTMSTYQAVSGAGSLATEELFTQSRQLMEGVTDKNGAKLVFEYHPKQIAFNIIPQIGDFTDNGYTSEEMKTHDETRKIMHMDDLNIGTTCVRVPVETTHSGDVTIEFDNLVEPADARRVLSEFDGVTVLDDLGSLDYPMPINATGVHDVIVGRIRRDIAHKNGLKMWFSCDNLLKGAALNSLQIVDEVVKRNCLPKRSG